MMVQNNATGVSENHCDRCGKVCEADYRTLCESCWNFLNATHRESTPYYKPISNGDKIRTMSDEELADFFADVVARDRYIDVLSSAWLDWLKRPSNIKKNSNPMGRVQAPKIPSGSCYG